ncbi:hypothetical protein AMTRI_Chr13g91750 [Amborella trichopoda]
MADSSNESLTPSRGWGGWGASAFSVFSDFQKAAAEAAGEISRNAVEAAKNAAKDISDLQNEVKKGSESDKEEKESEKVETEEVPETEEDKRRRSALDKLEKASEDTLLGQGLKAFDHSVENIASGAWQAFGNAWKGGSSLVHKLENSAANLADSIQKGGLPGKAGSIAPSLVETGKALTAKGIQVLEYVGKETMDLLITETGFEVEKDPKEAEEKVEEEEFAEEVTFDRCFYIYGGPEQLEELEALSNHHALLFNRRKAKLSSEQKSSFDGNLKQVQQTLTLSSESDGNGLDHDKGKYVDTVEVGGGNEMQSLCTASVSKAAEMAAGFAAALGGLAANEILQRTSDRLESIHSEGIHRLSELCCFGVSQLLMLGKSVLSSSAKSCDDEIEEEETLKIEWPDDSVSKAKIIRLRAQFMTGDVEAVSNSFITGISDVVGAFQEAIKSASADGPEALPEHASIHKKADAISTHLRNDRTMAISKIQDGLHYLPFVVISAST